VGNFDYCRLIPLHPERVKSDVAPTAPIKNNLIDPKGKPARAAGEIRLDPVTPICYAPVPPGRPTPPPARFDKVTRCDRRPA
jgi:hypothetical protein